MSGRRERTRPLVVTISRLPIFSAAVAASLAGRASVHALEPAGRDTETVLRVIDPDTVVVDDPLEARLAAEAVAPRGIRVVHVASDELTLRVLGKRGWCERALPAMGTEAFESVLRSVALEHE